MASPEKATDLTKLVYVFCDCDWTCQKDGHRIEPKVLGEGARCSVWISRRHLCVVAAQTSRRIAQEGLDHERGAIRSPCLRNGK